MNQIKHLEYIRDEFNKIPDDMFEQRHGWVDKEVVKPNFDYKPVCVGCHIAIILGVTAFGSDGVEFYGFDEGVERLAEIMGITYNDLEYRIIDVSGEDNPLSAHNWEHNYKEIMTEVINDRIKELKDESN